VGISNSSPKGIEFNAKVFLIERSNSTHWQRSRRPAAWVMEKQSDYVKFPVAAAIIDVESVPAGIVAAYKNCITKQSRFAAEISRASKINRKSEF
jgi:hypothetical protein